MPDSMDDIKLLATLVADVKNITSKVNEISVETKKGDDRHLMVMTQLAVMDDNLKDAKTYQEKCDRERTEIVKSISDQGNSLEKKISEQAVRITAIEGYQNRQLKYALAAWVVLTGLVNHGGTILEKIGKWFQ